MNITGDLTWRMSCKGYKGFGGACRAFYSGAYFAVLVYRFGRFAQRSPLPLSILFKIIYFFLFYIVQTLSGISVQAYAKIGRCFSIQDSGCIFVVAESIGENFVVSSGVTVGNVRGSKRLPIIGSNVYIEPGAKILGEITIGDNVVVRANSLVLADVPGNSIVQGNPARIIPREKVMA